ncbi:MAG: pantetheine-phosphate adenylyltransferase [Lachnospiraceae bacterium]|jgi:pantetheine-phosphate adenylyltransferase|nr:pantetheine-phosphate adenylyltransferase [Lachnospiraceae bacterium]MDE7057682.1 pantetheine-phosphate adenylyltransferase [Lachnospiraceae bacterium]
MIRAIYPGSFDPVTLGHLDIMKRASKTVDELIVGVLNNGGKTPLFTIDERVSMLKEVTEGLSNVKILSFSGLLVDFARQTEATVVVRGLRAISDFEYELQMAQTNHKLNPNVDTMFLATSLEYSYLSSTIVKEVAFFQGDIKEFVPEQIVERIKKKVKEKLQ